MLLSSHWWRRPGDAAAVALLAVLPALAFGVPALLGHPVLPGDDMTQNFPLRVLAGREIATGHLPLFDPYAWSGSALLAGWNAGAAYPLTWLFAILPGVAAWTTGLIVTWATAGTGLFAFLRALRLRPAPAFCGALSFALAGAMSAQVSHFGLVAGMSWVPLALLAVLRLSGSSRTDSGDSPGPGLPLAPRTRVPRWHLRWAALLAAAVGLIILAGEPRAIVDGELIVGIYAAWRAGRAGLFGSAWRRALPGAPLIACGCALGAALGAVQWLPGLAAVSSSQRGIGSMALFADGSLPSRWLVLTLVPDLLGGSGSLSQPGFFGSYNLAEITSYVGVLPLVAAFALLGRAVSSLVRRRGVPEYLVWHGIGATGVVLALGGNSPLAAVLYRVPLFGTQRLQSRNILLLDLALAVLLAYWLDRPFPAGSPAGSPGAFPGVLPAVRGRVRRVSPETLAGLLPPLAIGVLVMLGLTWGAGLLHWLGIPAATSAAETGPLRPWLIPFGVLAAAAAVLVLAGRRLGPAGWSRACTTFVVADVVVFTVLGVVRVTSAPAPAPAASPAPSSPGLSLTAHESAAGSADPAGSAVSAVPAGARPVSDLGYPGRFAIYNPNLEDTSDLSVIGPPNTNDMDANGMPSVQGYSSLVDGAYAAATGSHHAVGDGQNVLSPAAVGDGTLDRLDTSILLTLPGYLTTSPGSVAAAPGGLGQRRLGAGRAATWYLGQSVTLSRVVVPDAGARASAAGTEIGLTAPDGRVRWFRARAASRSELEVGFSRPVAATAVLARDRAARGTAPLVLGAPSVGLADGRALVADGQLQNVLVPPRWGMAGFDGGFAVFSDRFAAGPLTAEPIPGRSGSAGRYARALSGSAIAASVRYDTSVSGDAASAAVSSPRGVRLVRSVAAIPGWSATWQPRNGHPATLAVQRDGVVQAVDVPAGQGTVTWHYMTPGFPAGMAVSVMAALLTLVLAVAGRRPRPAARPAFQRELETQAV